MENDSGGLVGSAVAGFTSTLRDGGSRTESVSEVYDRSGYTEQCIYCAQGRHRHSAGCFSLPLLYFFFFSEGSDLYALHFCNLRS